MKSVYGVVGDGIRTRRLRLGLTLEELSELSGLHASYIGQIERNAKKASLETIAALAQALKVPVRDLFCAPAEEDEDLHAKKVGVIIRAHRLGHRELIYGVVRQLSRSLKELP
jgi:transcriptional regulator with XRE-family HTH domain